MWCTFADQADCILIVARTTPYNPDRRHAGIRRFIADKKPGDSRTAAPGMPIRKIGYHGWHTWELSFNDCFVPDDCLLGYERVRPATSDAGFSRVAEGMLTRPDPHGRRSIGLARGALEDSIAYAQQRGQFGHPSATSRAIRFKIA